MTKEMIYGVPNPDEDPVLNEAINIRSGATNEVIEANLKFEDDMNKQSVKLVLEEGKPEEAKEVQVIRKAMHLARRMTPPSDDIVILPIDHDKEDIRGNN